MSYEHENCYVLEKDDKYGLYLPLAEKEIATKYRWIDVVSKELAIVSTKYSSRLLSLVYGEMQGGEFFDLDSYSEGLFVSQLLEVSKTGTITRVGIVDETGTWMIVPQFEDAKAF